MGDPVPMYLVFKLANFEVRMLLVKDLAASSVTSRMSHIALVQHANILALMLKLFRTSSITPPQSTSLALCLLSASPCDCFHNRRHNQKFIVWNSLYTASSGYYNTGTLSVLVCLLLMGLWLWVPSAAATEPFWLGFCHNTQRKSSLQYKNNCKHERNLVKTLNNTNINKMQEKNKWKINPQLNYNRVKNK